MIMITANNSLYFSVAVVVAFFDPIFPQEVALEYWPIKGKKNFVLGKHLKKEKLNL